MKNKTKKLGLSKAKVERIYRLITKGLSQREVAEKIGCSRSAVYYWLHHKNN